MKKKILEKKTKKSTRKKIAQTIEKVEPTKSELLIPEDKSIEIPVAKKIMYAGKEVVSVEDFQDEQGSQKKICLSDGSIEIMSPELYGARISEE